MQRKCYIVSPKGELLRVPMRVLIQYNVTESKGSFFLWIKVTADRSKQKRSLLN